jgi:integral membrane sensor domain MASE1
MSEFIATARNRYSLAWNPNPPVTVARLVAVAVAAGVYTVLSWLGVIALPIGIVGVSSLFIAIGFGIPFAIWFGAWGLLIGYLGTFIGPGLLGGTPLLVAIPFSFVDWFQLGIPMLAYRGLANRFGVDPMGKDVYTARGIIFFVVFGVILPNAAGALYGITILSVGGLVPPEAFWPGVIGWWVGNMIVSIIIAPILLRGLSPVVERYGLTSFGLLT